MQVTFSPRAKEDFDYWLMTNKSISRKIVSLIEAIMNTPFEGIGKPEPLKHELSGAWSRRINREHRLIYEVDDEAILILSVKGHYI